MATKARYGAGGRFAALSNELASKGATNPDALAAFIGMGGKSKSKKTKFLKAAAAGRKRATKSARKSGK